MSELLMQLQFIVHAITEDHFKIKKNNSYHYAKDNVRLTPEEAILFLGKRFPCIFGLSAVGCANFTDETFSPSRVELSAVFKKEIELKKPLERLKEK